MGTFIGATIVPVKGCLYRAEHLKVEGLLLGFAHFGALGRARSHDPTLSSKTNASPLELYIRKL